MYSWWKHHLNSSKIKLSHNRCLGVRSNTVERSIYFFLTSLSNLKTSQWLGEEPEQLLIFYCTCSNPCIFKSLFISPLCVLQPMLRRNKDAVKGRWGHGVTYSTLIKQIKDKCPQWCSSLGAASHYLPALDGILWYVAEVTTLHNVPLIAGYAILSLKLWNDQIFSFSFRFNTCSAADSSDRMYI